MRNTIRKVTIVVPVLMTSCQLSLNRNSGPVINHTRMRVTARMNVAGRPAPRDVALATRVNHERDFVGSIREILNGKGMRPLSHD
jgi:hypothetical protein